MITAEIIKDSTNWLGKRLTTLKLVYPRYIHSEFMTHRVLSKNSASSRAIPVQKFIDDIYNNPVNPSWTLHQKGMQGPKLEDQEIIRKVKSFYNAARNTAVLYAKSLTDLNIHKQNVNRLLEPFMHMTVICTGTEWDNFFELRDHPDAQPEIQELARAIKTAMENSKPDYLDIGDWHIPFGDQMDEDYLIERSYKLLYASTGWETAPDKHEILDHVIKTKLQIATARCARVSYLTFEGKIDYKKDLELYHQLVNNKPIHASPTEHIARVPTREELSHFNSGWINVHPPNVRCTFIPKYTRGKYVSNLEGWIQYRKIIENE